ncbi:MAG: hypothetical protein H7831_18310 [Magnetococcus sp. WYHC-3]
MTTVEANAYRLVLRNGTLAHAASAIFAMSQAESDIPDDLLTDLIDRMRASGHEGRNKFLIVVYHLIGKTRSLELYRAAEELEYLKMAPNRTYVNPKVYLFASEMFYTPELEAMAIDELYIWLNYVNEKIRERYVAEGAIPAGRMFNDPEYDERINKSELSYSPLIPIGRILYAMQQIGALPSREYLLALEHLFRPQVDSYLAVEAKWAKENDPRAAKLPETPPKEEQAALIHTAFSNIGPPTVYQLSEIIDWAADVGRSAVNSAGQNKTGG